MLRRRGSDCSEAAAAVWGEDDEKHRIGKKRNSGILREAEADENRLIDPIHRGGRKFAYALLETALVDGTDLLEKNHAVLGQPVGGGQLYVSGKLRFVDLTGDGSGDDGGGVFVPDIVLHHQNGTYAALFAADHRR